jgi:hypothetical protein
VEIIHLRMLDFSLSQIIKTYISTGVIVCTKQEFHKALQGVL